MTSTPEQLAALKALNAAQKALVAASLVSCSKTDAAKPPVRL
jgi:hypothetical protein